VRRGAVHPSPVFAGAGLKTICHLPQVYQYPPNTDVVRPNLNPVQAVEVIHYLWVAVEEFVKVMDVTLAPGVPR
jgi:hypothetical protein